MAYLPSLSTSLLVMSAVLCLGCPGDDGSGEDGPGSADATATASSSTTDEGTTTDVATSAGSGTDTTVGSGDSTGPGVACGESTCSSNEYCEWNANSCGTLDFDEGSCEPRPEGCTADYAPVCGCDGEVYSNACGAWSQGVDVDADGECEPPDGYFRCGYQFCDIQTTYCRVGISDVGGEPDTYECIDPTMPCSPIDCSCLESEPCFEFGCEVTEGGGAVIVCPGG